MDLDDIMSVILIVQQTKELKASKQITCDSRFVTDTCLQELNAYLYTNNVHDGINKLMR